MFRFLRWQLALGWVLMMLAGCATQPAAPKPATRVVSVDEGLAAIQHIVVIYAENRSFDHLYGLFPGANGVASASPEAMLQLDHDGSPLKKLPPVWDEGKPQPLFTFPGEFPNGPFRLDLPPVSHPLSIEVPDLVHAFYQSQEQINDGKMNQFVEVSDSGALTMGYYDGSSMKMWRIAKEFTLADNFFMGAFGGSYLNHMWLVCACTPVFANAPLAMVSRLDAQGRLLRTDDSPRSALDGPAKYTASSVTPDGYSVNTTQPPYQPSGVPPIAGGDVRYADPAGHPLPPQTAKTIGDTLSDKGISWAWYAGAWNAALADGIQDPDALRAVIYNTSAGAQDFRPHHQPLNYFASFAPGSKAREEHLKDGSAFIAAIEQGNLPEVSFYKPQGSLDQHPGYSDVLAGDKHIAELVDKLRASPLWSSTAIIVTYDENGGFWDHVAPPKGDRWGPAVRVPAIVISPYAKHGFVDHTQYDTTSIVKFISRRFALQPLPGVRANAGDLTAAFDFSQVTASGGH